MRFILICTLIAMLPQSSFKQTQLKHSRVKTAYEEKETIVKAMFTSKNLQYTGFHLFIRAFKSEQKLEIWVRETGKETFALLNTYDFCQSSGTLGPKRREGDLQIPEGIYHINYFNPISNFYLSLGISYPNASDRVLSDKEHPGSAIYIHGNCVTIGCIPITDEKIKELYVLAVEARNHGQQNIPIHIFPSRLDAASMTTLERESPEHTSFWRMLQPIYQDFELTKKLKNVRVNGKGEYQLR